MKEYTVSQAAQEANVSVRTLHHYDQIDLLSPSSRAANGYRYYTEADLSRLYDILFYRALGLSLKQIAQVLQDASEDRHALLILQRQQLDEHIERLQRMRRQLIDTLEKEEQVMAKDKKFDVLEGFDPDQYEDEVKEKWGQTDAYKESARRTKQYSKDDWARYKQEANNLNEQMAALMDDGHYPDSAEALAVVEKMRLQIDTWFYPCSRAMHAQLGEMYVMDARFTETYEKIHTGMAEFMKAATAANFKKHGE